MLESTGFVCSSVCSMSMSQSISALCTPDSVCHQTGLVSSSRSLLHCHIPKYTLTEDVCYVKVHHLLSVCVLLVLAEDQNKSVTDRLRTF